MSSVKVGSKDDQFDVVIVGAGIAGASLAYRLTAEGPGQKRVMLLERESQPGYHSTGRSAAMFMETYGTQQIQALTRASRAFYEQPPAGFTDHPLLGERGCLYIASADQRDTLMQSYEAAAAQAGNVQLLDGEQAMARVPCIRPDAVAGGALFEPDARDLDVHALHQGFLAGARRHGAVLRCHADVESGQRSDDGVWTLRFKDGATLRAGVLVNAAGAWADDVARACGVAPVGLQPCRRSAFTFAPPDGVDCSTWPAVVGIDESFYFKPDAGQLLGSPANADPVAPHDVVAEELDVATGIYHIESATTLTIRRPSHVWAGLRSFVPDGDMVVGYDEGQPGFFWLAAQGGYGIQSAAGVSALAAALLLRQPLPVWLVDEGVAPSLLAPGRLR
ncbi:NAD(P)/FAD-dependent oxidoreductase [Achromobacter piechaudii]|uniref:FAD-dependent catabolic D-arginine dehydrogenase DauA n=1 Tax=Achromobacter piechaudii TaxID=72556 RepID=A0ABM8KWH1_9BURK|nr:FAD-dependent oxidoreductase [Achromobacter piechaudii]CAB3694780.1 FAD-dependent catabolic D-arginine dehydrogenase DauA [Achromobacter piechaudii]CAB3858044.1 FAD-dependent catabolic D-arginine dehydrogenase DauA [Achromobacter piechaudii]CAB3949992.1 FAD-dependent catabolic D-arginine dehydrogenase DauA [Achromobacter piechaudii]